MKLADIIRTNPKTLERAKQAAKYLRRRYRNNPLGHNEHPSGWRADPHQGHHGGINWR